MLSAHVLATESYSGHWERKWHVISKSTFTKIWRKEENSNKFLGSQGHWKHWTVCFFSLTKCLTSQLTLAPFREMPVDGGCDGTVTVAQSLVAGFCSVTSSLYGGSGSKRGLGPRVSAVSFTELPPAVQPAMPPETTPSAGDDTQCLCSVWWRRRVRQTFESTWQVLKIFL